MYLLYIYIYIDTKSTQHNISIAGQQLLNSMLREKDIDAFGFLKILEDKQTKGDITIYNTLLDACFKNNKYSMGKEFFRYICRKTEEHKVKSKEERIVPDVVSFNIYIKGLKLEQTHSHSIQRTGEDIKYIKYIKYEEEVAKVISEMGERGLVPNEITFNTSIDLFVEIGNMGEAWKYFEQMKVGDLNPDVFTYSTLIKGIKNHDENSRNLQRVFEVISMECEKYIRNRENIANTFDEILFNSLIDACLKFGENERAERGIKLMKNLGVCPSPMTYGILIKSYGQYGLIESAMQAFTRMKEAGIHPNQVTYGCLLDGCVKADSISKLEEVYTWMLADQIPLNVVICTTLIKGFSRSKMFQKALEVYTLMNSQGIVPNIISYNAMLNCCVLCSKFEKMKEIFRELECSRVVRGDVITYSTYMKGLCRAGDMKEVYNVYQEVKSQGILLDEVLFNCILNGFAKAQELEHAITVYNDMNQLNIPRSNVTYSILIKAYSNARMIDKALEIYEHMKQQGVGVGLVVYTCLIQACIKHKKIDLAIHLFYEMKGTQSLLPDHVVFNTIVNGCIFAGRLQVACQIFLHTIDLGIRLHVDIYNNLLKNLLTNKKLNRKIKQTYSLQILSFIKQNQINVKSELYQKVVNMTYNYSQRVEDY